MTKFLIIGNQNDIACKDIFPHIKDNEMWLGTSNNVGMYFLVPEDYEYTESYKFKRDIEGEKVCRVANVCWLTNIENPRRNLQMELSYKYDSALYPKYDDYDAIEVGNVSEIPDGYYGIMGVPLTFFYRYCPSQFEIIGLGRFSINGKRTYARILIRRIRKKKFLVIGNKNAIQWKTVFPIYMDGKIRFGYNSVNKFIAPNGEIANLEGLGRWFTNMEVHKNNPPLELVEYDEKKHQKYDTFDAVNSNSIKEIPDVDCLIGVPIGIFDYICDSQFEIVGMLCRGSGGIDFAKPIVNGKHLYTRIAIRKYPQCA